MSQAKDQEKFLITAALPYANGPLHIGHLAGAYLPADIFSRYQKLRGNDALFVCGSDEHGTAITLKSRMLGIKPSELVEKYHHQFKEVFAKLNIGFDYYHRTSSELHHKTASDLFRKLYEDGRLFEQESEQFYDTEVGMFLADRYIYGTCPSCGSEGAYGDQCEKCGTGLSPKELIEPRSTLSHQKPEMRKTHHWFFPLDEYEDWLKQWILEENKDQWKTNVVGQCKSWLDQSLRARSFTRDLDWGVPVPIEGMENKVLYVWVDAPVGYISATKAWANERAENDSSGQYSKEDWKQYWQQDDSRLVHFIGKDNIFFHCIMFPAMLKAHGDFVLPDNVPANEFMNLEGSKISTSRNWAIWLHDYVEEHPDKIDILRYTLTMHSPETSDSDFSWEDFKNRNNNELVGILGNFVNRVIVLINKHFEGQIPPNSEKDYEDDLFRELDSAYDNIESYFEKYRLRDALTSMMDIARLGNRFLNETEPWNMVKEDKEKAGAVLNAGVQIAAHLSVAAEPFIPTTARQLGEMLNLNDRQWKERKAFRLLEEGRSLRAKKGHLFSKLDDDFVAKQKEKLQKKLEEAKANEESSRQEKADVDFEEFNKLNILAATVKDAEKVPKADKLLKLTLSLGQEERVVVAGIAKSYSPEAMKGKQVCLVENIKPRKIKGIESRGMVLMASDKDGNMTVISPEASMPDGTSIS